MLVGIRTYKNVSSPYPAMRLKSLGAKSLAAVADTEPNFNNAAVKQTLQVDVRADFKNLLAARRYSADRSDCDN